MLATPVLDRATTPTVPVVPAPAALTPSAPAAPAPTVITLLPPLDALFRIAFTAVKKCDSEML